MTAQEWLVLAGSVAAGAAAALAAVAVAMRLGRRGSPARTDLDVMRRLALRLRRLQRVARETERRLEGHVDELRRLLSEAEGKAAAGAAGESSPGAAPPAPDATPDADKPLLPGILEKQKDLIFRLRLQGLEPVDIARRLHLPVGEVELTLRLHDKEAGTYRRDRPAQAASQAPDGRAEAGT